MCADELFMALSIRMVGQQKMCEFKEKKMITKTVREIVACFLFRKKGFRLGLKIYVKNWIHVFKKTHNNVGKGMLMEIRSLFKGEEGVWLE